MHIGGLYHEFNPLQISDSYKTVQCWPLQWSNVSSNHKISAMKLLFDV